jgi:tetratricopeptide (TPR) repeat protein
LQDAADGFVHTLGASNARAVLAQYELAPVLAHLSHFKQAEATLARADKAAGAGRGIVSEIALQAHLARGQVAYQRMQVKQALAEYQAAERLQPLLHPNDAAMSVHILLAIAGCELRTGQSKRAEAVARKILAGASYTQARIGLAAIATARSRLASALRAQNRDREAIPVLQQALGEYEKAQGPDSQGAISTLSDLANEYAWIDNYAKALPMQREVYARASKRWGAQSQYALVELLNLGAEEHDSGDLKSALSHLQQAKAGLIKVSGANSPVAQSARVVLATTLADLGRNQEALNLLDEVDPTAYQSTSTDPGRALVLAGFKASLEYRLHEPGAEAKLRKVIAAMQAAGLDKEEIDTFRKELPPSGKSSVAGIGSGKP